jgi:uncharacterized cupin superfamily protein
MACRTFAAGAVEVPQEPLPAGKSVAGAPRAGVVLVPDAVGLGVGVWEHSAGTSIDVEVDEVFVVLRGRATIEVEGGPTLQVGPGDLCVLEAGARTRWTVHEALRKVFVCPG